MTATTVETPDLTPSDAAPREELRVRPYEPRDRQAVRELCCDTGFLGNPIDPVFEDRELFANFLTSYYLDREPQCCFVLEQGGQVKGYLLGARKRFKLGLAEALPMVGSALKLLWRYPRYNAASRAYVRWLLTRGTRETPESPEDAAHFHINIVPEARTVGKTRELLNAFFEHLRRQGETRVYGQMVTFEKRRTEGVFRRYGFSVLNRAEITKYRAFTDQPVYLTTVVRELEPAAEDGESYTFRTRRHSRREPETQVEACREGNAA